MKSAPYPEYDSRRLEALKRFDILDTLAEQEYDSITQLAAIICGTPFALVSLIDEHRQWFKSKVGLDVTETPRSVSFCAHAILIPDDIFIVPDALQDERFSDNPLVSSAPKIRFYAGYPLTMETGDTLGSLCVIDTVPRTLTDEQKKALKLLAGQVVTAIETRVYKKELLELTRDLEASTLQKTKEVQDRIEAETKLKEVSEINRLIVESSPDMIFVKDAQLRFVMANHALLSAFPEEIRGGVIGTTAMESFTKEEQQGYQANDLKAFNEGSSETIETASFGHNESTTLFTKKVRFSNAKGERFILGMARDISDIMKTEDALRESSRLNDAILSSASHMIIATDTEGNVLVFNSKAEHLLGYKAEEVLHQKTPVLWHREEEILERAKELSREAKSPVNPDFSVFTHKVLEHGSEEREWTFIRKDGTSFPGSLTATALKEHNGNVAGFLYIIQDITGQKQLDRLKSDFISTVSHELRTPLTSIRGSLGLVKAGIVGDMAPKARQMTEIAYKNVERLILLINDILDIDKIESGEMRFNIELHDVNNLLNQTMESNLPYAEKLGVRFTVEPIVPSAQITVDADRFIQVLSNLLSNAAKFSKAGDEIHLTVARRDKTLRISVIDNGSGIPEEFHSRIFSKFAQADSSASRQKGGTGLGLNISKKFIERMNGEIGFESVAGMGSTFWIEFPEAADPSFSTPRKPVHIRAANI